MHRVVAVFGFSLTLMFPAVASAASNQTNLGRCVSDARHMLKGTGITFDVEQFATVTLGTNGEDLFGPEMTSGPDLVCGFGGNNFLGFPYTFGPGDMYVGGNSYDLVADVTGGTVIGGEGDDSVANLKGGLFLGGVGNDQVYLNMSGGTFDGGPGDDAAALDGGGVFNGGPGDDVAGWIYEGTFNGGDGNDSVPLYLYRGDIQRRRRR